MIRQIEWRLQNGSITTSGVLPVTALFFFGKFVGKFLGLRMRNFQGVTFT